METQIDIATQIRCPRCRRSMLDHDKVHKTMKCNAFYPPGWTGKRCTFEISGEYFDMLTAIDKEIHSGLLNALGISKDNKVHTLYIQCDSAVMVAVLDFIISKNAANPDFLDEVARNGFNLK